MTDEITTGVTGGEVAAPQNEQVEAPATPAPEQSVDNSGVADQKPVQDTQTNAAFAQMRREAEQAKRDRDTMIADLYGQQGITTWDQYQAALKQQEQAREAEKRGVDPQFYSEFNQVKGELESIRREKTLLQQDNQLANDPNVGSFYKQYKTEIQEIANQYNADYDTATTLLLREKIGSIMTGTRTEAEQSAIQKLTQNAQSSPGALGAEGADHKPQSVGKMAKKDFEDLVKLAKQPGGLREF